MNYTTNYHLPQWVESDRILMEDFNQAMETLDGGIAAAKATADTAKTTAETAQSAAETAFYAYIVPFLVSTAGGAVIAGVLLYALQKASVLHKMQLQLSR